MQTKQCSKCKLVKSIDHFYKDKRHKDGYHSGCMECHKNNNKSWRERNKNKVQNYNINRGVKFTIQHNILQYTELAKSLGLRTTITQDHIDEVVDHWNKKCAYCGKTPTIIDYIIPVNKKHKGPNIKHNMVPACELCHTIKNETDLFFYSITSGKPIISILIWAARDYQLITQLDAYRERLYSHSFVEDIQTAIQTAMAKPVSNIC